MGLSEAEVAAFENYFFHIMAARGSGEHALRHLLAPFARAKHPLEGRLHDLKVWARAPCWCHGAVHQKPARAYERSAEIAHRLQQASTAPSGRLCPLKIWSLSVGLLHVCMHGRVLPGVTAPAAAPDDTVEGGAGAVQHHLRRARLDGPARGAARRGRRRARARAPQLRRLPGGALVDACAPTEAQLARLALVSAHAFRAHGEARPRRLSGAGCRGAPAGVICDPAYGPQMAAGVAWLRMRLRFWCMQVDLIPEAGHYPFLDQPQAFLQTLLAQTRGAFPGWEASRPQEGKGPEPGLAAEAG